MLHLQLLFCSTNKLIKGHFVYNTSFNYAVPNIQVAAKLRCSVLQLRKETRFYGKIKKKKRYVLSQMSLINNRVNTKSYSEMVIAFIEGKVNKPT